MADPAPLDCQACGACCATFDVRLTPDDEPRFAARPALAALTVLYAPNPALTWRFMQRTDGRCAALSGGMGRCTCTIYADRPTLCREFQVDTPDCHAARRARGLE